MLDTEEDEREDTPMRNAVQRAEKLMYVVFHNRRRQLKVTSDCSLYYLAAV